MTGNFHAKHFLITTFLLTACVSIPQATIEPTKPTAVPTIESRAVPTALPTSTAISVPTIYYIDSDLPGADPQRFGENFFSGEFHSAPVFSSGGQMVWWGGEFSSQSIFTSRFISGAWTEPATIQFSDEITSYRDPFISPDGSKFYFISTAAIPGTPTTGKENIWMMEQQGEDWGDPQPLTPAVNALELHWLISVNNQYDLYFSARQDENTDIFLSRYINGDYTEPIRLDAPVNTPNIELTPNIAPDGSYMLFTRLASTSDIPHLYITYALDAGWSEPVRVDNIPYCISPIVTPDRSFVIYLSSPAAFEWRDTSFIEQLRP